MPLSALLATAGLPVVVVNPRQVRDFAKAIGVLAKTDAVDALVLARFAQAVRPPLRALKSEESQALEAVLTRRRQIVAMLTAERNRLSKAATPIATQIEDHIVWLQVVVRRSKKIPGIQVNTFDLSPAIIFSYQ